MRRWEVGFQQFPEREQLQEPPRHPSWLFVNFPVKRRLSRERSEVLRLGGAMPSVAPKGRQHLRF